MAKLSLSYLIGEGAEVEEEAVYVSLPLNALKVFSPFR